MRKLSGNRRKKYQAVITCGEKIVNGRIVPKQISYGVYETRREAREALSRYIVNPTNLDERNTTFGEIYESIFDNFPKSARNAYRAAFNYYAPIRDMRMTDIKARHMQLIADTTDGMSKSTQNVIKGLGKAVFQEALKNDVVLKDYSQFMVFPEASKRREASAYTKEELSVLFDYGPDWQKILVYTGMRVSELLSMRCENVHLDRDVPYLDVVKSKTAAGIRIIPIHPEIYPTVERNYRSGQKLIADPTNYNNALYGYKRFNELHQIDPTHKIHDLRRTFSTYAKRSGLDDFYRKAILGHAQGNLTDDIYTDAFLEDLYKQVCMVRFA